MDIDAFDDGTMIDGESQNTQCDEIGGAYSATTTQSTLVAEDLPDELNHTKAAKSKEIPDYKDEAEMVKMLSQDADDLTS